MEEPTRAEVEAAQGANDQRIQQLAQHGLGVTQDSITLNRVLHLCEHLFGDMDDPRRLAFEMGLAQRFAAELSDEAIGKARDEAMAARARQLLLGGVNGQQVPGLG